MAVGEKIFIAFDSTHAAMASQKKLAPFLPAVIPTPKQITASCGMTLVLEKEHAAQARALLADSPDILAACSWYDETYAALGKAE